MLPVFSVKDTAQSRDYYKNLLSGMNVAVKDVQVTPYAAQGDFSLTDPGVNTLDFYFDPANPQNANIDAANIGTYKNKSFLHGNLFLNTYLYSAVPTSAIITQWLATGPVTGLTNWLYRARNVGAVGSDQDINNVSIHRDQFPEMFFRFMRMKMVTGAGGGSVVTEWIFNGVRIDF